MTSSIHSLELADGRRIPLRIRVNARARRLILRTDPSTGGGVVTVRTKSMTKAALRFANSRADWLAARLEEHTGAPFVEGSEVSFRGVPHRIVLSEEAGRVRTWTCPATSRLFSSGPAITLADRVHGFLKRTARQDLEAAVAIYAERLGVRPAKLGIRDTTSRWGSCSAQGNLSFSWRLILAPPKVLQYVAAHEVAHLLEMNHSPAFWRHVEDAYGNCREERRWLKTHGGRLHTVGKSGSAGG